MTDRPYAEHRKNPRFQVNVPVQVRCGGHVVPGMLRNVCRDACLVELHQPLDMGSHVSIVVELPGTGGPMEVGGSRVRVGPGIEPEASDGAVAVSHTSR